MVGFGEKACIEINHSCPTPSCIAALALHLIVVATAFNRTTCSLKQLLVACRYRGARINLDEVAIPESVKTIDDYCFDGCLYLTMVNIEYGVKKLGKGCFFQCRNLKEIVLPESITTIGAWCFSSTDLREINLPENLEELGESCFSGLYRLFKITLHEGVTYRENLYISIKAYSFSGRFLQ